MSGRTELSIGVDVGGTKVAVAAVSGTEVVASTERPTDLTGSHALLSEIESGVRELIGAAGSPAAVGVGVPSQVEFASGRVLASVNIPLAGLNLRDELTSRLGMPVYVDNDANCAALAESHLVEDAPARHLVMYTLGTGVGGGIVLDGRIFRGATGLGAELGHQVIDVDGPKCPGACPNSGCVEAFCSGQALARDGTELARRRPDSPLGRALAERGRLLGRDVVVAARDGDPEAVELFERLGRMLGAAISGAINTFEPEHVVLGGGLSTAGELFFEQARREAVARSLPSLADDVSISLARGGPAAGVIGAARLAVEEHALATGHTERATTREGVS